MMDKFTIIRSLYGGPDQHASDLCLSGYPIGTAKLMIEQAEEALRRHGFRVCRVRHHDTIARLEIGRDEMARALIPESTAPSCRNSRQSAISTCVLTCRATAPAA